jgi:hypothetical protein
MTPNERLDLSLASSDLWRRHGPLNVIVTLGSPFLGLAGAIALVAKGTHGTMSVLVLATMLAAPLTNRQLVRSAFAIVSRRPYLTLSDSGLHVDGWLCDSLDLAWSDIEAMSPEPATIQAALKAGSFVVMTLRARSGVARPWMLHSIRHSVHRNYFEVTGYFTPPPAPIVDAIAERFASRVERHEPFLLSDADDS